MDNGVSKLTYGGLDGYAMTFTMSASTGFGWLWRLYNSLDDQGVMSLNTAGELTVLGDSQFESSLTVGPNAFYVGSGDPLVGGLTAWEYGNSIFVLDDDARLYLQGTSENAVGTNGSGGAAVNLADVDGTANKKVFVMQRSNKLGDGHTWFKVGNDNGTQTPATFWFMKFDAVEEEIHMNLPLSATGLATGALYIDGATDHVKVVTGI
jgi:hypothetical protein